MHLGRLFQRSVQMHGDRPALAMGCAPAANYAELDARIRALAYWMRRDLGLEPGDRVTLAMKNRAEYAQALLAAWHAGLCAVPVNSKLHPNEIDYILRDSQSRLCLTDANLYKGLRPVADDIKALHLIDVEAPRYAHAATGPQAPETIEPGQDSHAPAWLFYTSGTTGRPKGVVLSHANLVNMALNFYADVQPVDDTDVLLHVAPMSHGSGLYSVPCFLKGALQVVPSSGGFDEAETCELLQHYRNASLFAAPTIVQRLAEYVASRNAPLPGLKSIIVAGAPFYVEDIKQAVRVLGPRIAQIYGQGESPMSITAQTASRIARAVEQNDDEFLGSVGHAQASIEISIEDASGNRQKANQAGEIMVSGPTVMQGYWQNPQASHDTLRDGKLHTGDIGLIDGRGLLHLKDRSKDVIISGGTNIYPREVEETLMQHPDVAEVSVIGMPDPHWGESILAFVVRREGRPPAGPAELDALCLSRMARFKRPKRYVFLDQLPKNATGKVLKRQLYDLVPPTP
ncbi:class I adenylate-forming enzyme family protein [Pusillimonas noertemannii]|uniref:Acyl-CoA synthetase (AMP-forming)/AMP-acid ligase II n=1 Tax=Pusillimonas noertemannii TaxID=305977 RepID=A0A2U1CHK1_9BURK|nr:AMP-binding protein [Pusillimonas noertemannii]NYT70255.1 AMP-binding protein [Pusillimonas noertemannii]PVY60398.1 acyl-CoA synthetase (AMP-forming)/AMP-acid ligase II [Pusillimonas noertemannii]TFL08103.1 long-chain fatty acid--CoA ligase [Pusillimonas noertemannii]